MDKTLQQQLAAPFADADIEWRLQWADDEKGSGIAVPYVTNRAIQNRLDTAVGIDGWKNDYISWHNDGKKASQICGISIYSAIRGDWITKYDGAENSDIEPIKGGLSDSMKRAAVQWGVGRYLYSVETVFVQTEKRGRNTIIKSSEQSKLDKAHQRAIAKVFGSLETTSPVNSSRPTLVPTEESATPPPRHVEAKSKNTYLIKNVALHPTMKKTNNTHLQLEDSGGKLIQVHMQGENPGLVPGISIQDVKIRTMEKDGIVYNILEEFRFVRQAAA